MKQSDKLTDLTYSVSFFLLATGLFIYFADFSVGKWILTAMIGLWSIRLGSYLFMRIHRTGKDARFDEMRPSFFRYLGFWTLQSVSIWILALPFIFGYTEAMAFGIFQWVGVMIWLSGFLIETVADWQKFQFKSNKATKDTFIDIGLWKYLRHPNYLGEILVWVGVFIFVIPVLSGFSWISIISPFWIILLLVKVSGIPLLEKRAWERYGNRSSYHKYINRSYRLVPFLY
jgi:steroid 5-alpha reductase family enzyme